MQGIPFYPIPDEAKTQIHWIEGGQAGDANVGGDRHMLILDSDNRILYELYKLKWDTAAGKWRGGSGAAWDLKKNGRRPETWTSADAAGLAILPGLVRYDEVYGPGEIGHAFRLTLNDSNGYVFPASHVAGSNAQAPPLGARMRLKASKNISGFDPAMQKIFRAMKTYGLIFADNGTDMYIGGTYDTRWDNDVLNPAFAALSASDFEFVKLGYMPQVARRVAVDARAGTGTSSDANGVLEPGEAVLVEPAWTYQGFAAATLTGTASGLTGPAGAAYTLADAAASYGALPAVTTGDGAAVDCYGATGNCYRIQVSSPSARPAAHWDASFSETLSTSGIKKWLLHVGDSFGDVPRDHPFYAKIEALFHNGVTSGCATGSFCPDDSVPRSQMAIFIANALARGGGNVPASGIVERRRLFLRIGRGLALLRRRADGPLLQARALPRGAERDARLLGDALLPLRDGLAARDGGLHRQGDGRAGRGGGGAGHVRPGPRDRPFLQLQRRQPRPPLRRRARGRPVLQARELPLGHRGDRRAARRRSTARRPPVKRREMAKFLSNAMGLELYGP